MTKEPNPQYSQDTAEPIYEQNTVPQHSSTVVSHDLTLWTETKVDSFWGFP